MKKVVLGLMILEMGWIGQAFADLSKSDIEEIRKIVKEEVDGLRQEMITRIDDVNKRIDALQDLLYVILAGMFALVGFVIWDRRTALAPAVREIEAVKKKEEDIERALREFAKCEPRFAEAFKYAGLL